MPPEPHREKGANAGTSLSRLLDGYLPEGEIEGAQLLQWLFFEQERVMSGIGGARFRTLTGRYQCDLRRRL